MALLAGKDAHPSEPAQKGREENSQRIQNTSALGGCLPSEEKKQMQVNFM